MASKVTSFLPLQPSSSSSTTRMMNHKNDTAPQRKKAKTQKWRCDVCKVKTFVDIKECEAHEATCRAAAVSSHEGTTEPVVEPPRPKAVCPDEAATVKREQAQWLTAKKSDNAKRQRTSKNVDAVEQAGAKKVAKKKPAASSVHPFFQGGAQKTASAASQESSKKKSRVKASDSKECTDIAPENDQTKPLVTKAARNDPVGKRREKTNESGSVNAFFQGASAEEIKAMQAAQKVADFQVKRRRQQELERERRLKRQKHQENAGDNSGTDASPEQHDNKKEQPRRTSILYTRFPVPSHVLPKEDDVVASLSDMSKAASAGFWNDDNGQRKRVGKALREYLPWLNVPPEEPDEESPFVWNIPMCKESSLQKPGDFLLQAMDAFLVPDDEDGSSTEPRPEEPTTDSTDVGLPEAGRELADFVEKWKDVREEAQRRMKERNAKLAGRRKKTKAKPFRKPKHDDDSEDYFLSGSESEDEENIMASLFLLTGDVGVGKTSLVYKVAEQARCGVLEVNTTEARGAAALRKRIQEATQTHAANWNKKAGISSAFAPKDKPEEENPESAALMVILLDEVDLLYPENGDNGFWTALSDVSKKAKAPIVLTANQFPEELLSSSFRYQHAHVESSVDNCAACLLSAAKRAGFTVRPERKNSANSDARRIAYLAKGDYRRISLTLKALKAAPKGISQTEPGDGRLQLLCPCPTKRIFHPVPHPDGIPHMTSIQPQRVPANQLSLITITGNGFLAFAEPPGLGTRGGYPVTVRVGQKECPQARILDDTTILAACPPIIGEDDSGVHLLSPDLHYADVSISSSRRLGLVSTTLGMQIRDELSDGTPWVRPRNAILLEYHADKSKQQTSDTDGAESSEEHEFENAAHVSPKIYMPPDMNSKAAVKIISEGITAWLSQKHQIPVVDEPDDMEDDSGLEELQKASRSAALESDAAFFEDCGLRGLPLLAGGSIPVGTAEKSSSTLQFRCSQKEDRDSWYCGSNSFMVRPSPREGRLLSRTEQELRGCFHRFASSEAEEEGSDTAIFREEPDDDALLPQRIHKGLFDLPACLRSRSEVSVPICHDIAFNSRQQDIWKKHIDFLGNYAFAHNRADLKLFCRGLNREVDCLLDSTDYIDDRLLLDYMPLLRNMAVMERASEHFFNLQQDEEIVSTLSKRSRSTRSSAKKGREHYFETSFEYLKGLHDSEHARDIGKLISQGFLGYL